MWNFIRRHPFAFLTAVCLPLLVVRLDRYPAPWLDEGFKLNSARLLADTGIFGSRTAGAASSR